MALSLQLVVHSIHLSANRVGDTGTIKANMPSREYIFINLVKEIQIAVWVFNILRHMVTDVLDFVIIDGLLLSSSNCPMMDLVVKGRFFP